MKQSELTIIIVNIIVILILWILYIYFSIMNMSYASWFKVAALAAIIWLSIDMVLDINSLTKKIEDVRYTIG